MGIQEKDKKEKILIERYGEFSAENIRKYLRDGSLNNQRVQYSIREKATQIAQKTDKNALERIAEIVQSKMQKIKSKIASIKQREDSSVSEPEVATLVLEEIEVEDFKQVKVSDVIKKEQPKEVNPIVLDDSHER